MTVDPSEWSEFVRQASDQRTAYGWKRSSFSKLNQVEPTTVALRVKLALDIGFKSCGAVTAHSRDQRFVSYALFLFHHQSGWVITRTTSACSSLLYLKMTSIPFFFLLLTRRGYGCSYRVQNLLLAQRSSPVRQRWHSIKKSLRQYAHTRYQ
jgi:hypothetical protein